jgi:hypothetical protein
MGALPSTGALLYIQAKCDLHENTNICMNFTEVLHQEPDKFQEEIPTYLSQVDIQEQDKNTELPIATPLQVINHKKVWSLNCLKTINAILVTPTTAESKDMAQHKVPAEMFSVSERHIIKWNYLCAKGLGISFFKMPWCFTLVKLEGEGITEIRASRRQ